MDATFVTPNHSYCNYDNAFKNQYSNALSFTVFVQKKKTLTFHKTYTIHKKFQMLNYFVFYMNQLYIFHNKENYFFEKSINYSNDH